MEHLMQIGYNNVDHLSDLSMATVLFGLDVHTSLNEPINSNMN
jgi:hypothetical protein